jgi:hypothetical protein
LKALARSTTNSNRIQELASRLKDMFQMNHADLDFGTDCIMNTKR